MVTTSRLGLIVIRIGNQWDGIRHGTGVWYYITAGVVTLSSCYGIATGMMEFVESPIGWLFLLVAS
jgi:hypothetical protein